MSNRLLTRKELAAEIWDRAKSRAAQLSLDTGRRNMLARMVGASVGCLDEIDRLIAIDRA